MPLSNGALTVLCRLEAAGYRADLVGGCVRDMLLGQVPHDVDITTDATPEQMQAVFADMRTVDLGVRHGTLTVLVDGEPYEVTTYRVDGDYTDHRHPDGVRFSRRLEDDLSRRDFTVNAMCYHPSRGMTDLFSGREDLAARRIRAVGEPRRRFEEDALRILRALRFSSVLNFSIEPSTAAAIHETRGLLVHVAPERILVEWRKLLMGVRAAEVIGEFSDVVEQILPIRTLRADAVARAMQLSSFPARFASLFVDEPNPVQNFLSACDSLRTERDLRRIGENLLINVDKTIQNEGDMLALLGELGEDTLRELLRFRAVHTSFAEDDARWLSRAISSGRPCRLSELAIDGRRLMACGVRGVQVGEALARALRGAMYGHVANEAKALLAYAVSEEGGECDGL